jgi:hypothetical protein
LRIVHGLVFIVLGSCTAFLGFGWRKFVNDILPGILKPPFVNGLANKRKLRIFGEVFLGLAAVALIIDGLVIAFIGP